MDLFIGTIVPYAFNFAPQNWMQCQGQTLSISQFQAQFALLGTYYGGNGTTNFMLPDLRGRSAIGAGQGGNLPFYNVGDDGGNYQEALTINNLPSHNHNATFTSSGGGNINVQVMVAATQPASGAQWSDVPSTTNNVLAASSSSGQGQAGIWAPSASATPTIPMAGVTATGGGGGGTVSVATTGNGMPINIMNPYLALNFCICLNGIFPSRP